MKKTGSNLKCLQCKSSFYVPHWWLLKGAKFCSRKCYWKDKLGCEPWNKGTVGLTKGNNGSFTFCASNWKGSLSEYKSLHYWINKELRKADKCLYCGSTDNVAWANKSHKYRKKLDDYMPLCYRCHFKYDDVEKRRVKNV